MCLLILKPEENGDSALVLSSLGIITKDGDYVKCSNAWPAMRNSVTNSLYVSLAVQSSVQRLHSLPWIIRSWTGPISLAIFVPGEDYTVFTLMIRYIRRCMPEGNGRITYHAVYPKDAPPLRVTHEVDVNELSCSNPQESLQLIVEKTMGNVTDSTMICPLNILRNLARDSCKTTYSLSVDVDIVPSPFLFERLQLYLESKACARCVLVIPIYEIDTSATTRLPGNKRTLLELKWIENKARIFYEVINCNVIRFTFLINFTILKMLVAIPKYA